MNDAEEKENGICGAAGDGAEEIARLVPAGSVAAVFAECEETLGAYARLLRKRGITARRLPLHTSVRKLQEMQPDADVRLAVALGGNAAADCAKFWGKTHGLPVFAAVTSPCALRVLSPWCELYDGDVLRPVRGVAPQGAAAVCDLVRAGENELPAAFGELAATAVCLFDGAATARATGRRVNATLYERILDEISDTLAYAAEAGREDAHLPCVLAQASLGAARRLQGEEEIFFGGAECCARTAEMLFGYEARKPMLRGETAFVFGAVLAEMYRAFADAPSAFLPPPDNNLRAERLAEYLGWGELTAAKAATGLRLPVALVAYRLGEYRDELSEFAADACRLFEQAKRTFRRLYRDDGFSLRGALDSSDVRAVVALAPDTFPAGLSALALMRELGFLERYL
ncbi:MAG: hypothetical protein K2L51_07465 [Clostridiales bacterium]|nr:hypothetical protein [Clostridiales bacterium]